MRYNKRCNEAIMTGKDDIHRKVEQTMAGMDNMENLEASPYFFQKVQARLMERDRGSIPGFLGWVSAMVLRPTVISVIVLINLVSAVALFRDGGSSAAVNTSDEQTSYAAAFVAEYSLGSSQTTFDDYFLKKAGEGGN